MKQFFALTLFCFVVFFSNQLATAQNYLPDPTFAAPFMKNYSATLYTMVRQKDGKVVIGGDFDYVSKVATSRIARLNSDGSVDNSFAKIELTGSPNIIYSLALQADGKILVGGLFTSVNNLPAKNLFRLNSDGSIDGTFQAATDGSKIVNTIVLQPDGKILIQGRKEGTKDVITRLNTDGSIDSSFTFNIIYPFGGESRLGAIGVQPDGKILISGEFVLSNTTRKSHLVRLNPDGSPDDTFTVATEISAIINTIALQSDGKILIGGIFTKISSVPRMCIARLHGDGSLDESFNVGAGLDNNGKASSEEIYIINLLQDGSILIGGTFSSYNGQSARRLACLDTNGSLDIRFQANVGISTNGAVYTVLEQENGQLLVGGYFTSFSGQNKYSLVGLQADGALDGTYQTYLETKTGAIRQEIQADAKILLSGFHSINDTKVRGLVRINSNGTIDHTFQSNEGNGLFKLCPDSKILVVVDTAFSKTLIRLQVDGSVDNSFKAANFSNSITAIALQTDDKIVVVGSFTTVNGVSQKYLTRLNSDGSVDSSFNTGSGFDDLLYSVVVQADGKIIVGGWFIYYNGILQKQIARLHPDGSLDNSFLGSGEGTNFFQYQYVSSLTLQSDGKVLAAGNFSAFNGEVNNNFVRLHSDGSIDRTFTITKNAVDPHHSKIPIQPDGKLLFPGLLPDGSLVRLHPDGRYDSTFVVSGLQNSWVSTILLQADGKILVGTKSQLIRFANLQIQTIHFLPIADKFSTDNSFSVSATASSGLPVTYSIVSGPATINGNTITLTGVGTVTVRASQAGDGMYAAAPDVEISFQVIEVLGLEKYSSGMKLYPNPAQASFVIELPYPLYEVALQLVDTHGKVVYTSDVNINSSISVVVNHLPAGLYMLRVKTGKKTLVTKVVLR